MLIHNFSLVLKFFVSISIIYPTIIYLQIYPSTSKFFHPPPNLFQLFPSKTAPPANVFTANCIAKALGYTDANGKFHKVVCAKTAVPHLKKTTVNVDGVSNPLVEISEEGEAVARLVLDNADGRSDIELEFALDNSGKLTVFASTGEKVEIC